MTHPVPDAILARVSSNIPTPRAEIDPLTLTILLAALSAVITHYIERCLDAIDHRTAANPGIWHKYQLWRLCLIEARAAAQGAATQGVTATAEQIKAAAGDAYEAMLRTGAQLTMAEYAGLAALKAV